MHAIRPALAIVWATWSCVLVGATGCGGSRNTKAASGTAADADDTPPSIVIVSPENNTSTDDASVIVTGTATDAHRVLYVRILGVNATTSNDFATWTVTVPLALGPNHLVAAAQDELGNTNAAAAFLDITRIDAEPPLVTISTPVSDPYWTNRSQVTIEGTATDDTGVDEIRVNGITASTSDGFAHWTAKLTLASEGALRSVVVAARDILGNEDTSAAALSIGLDTMQPSIIADFPTITSLTDQSTALVAGRATDVSGLCRVSVNGTSGTAAIGTAGTSTWSAYPQVPVGGVDITVRVEDCAGNASELVFGHISNDGLIFPNRPSALAYDAGTNRLYVMPERGDAFVDLNLTTGVRKLVPTPRLATEPSYGFVAGMALDVGRSRLVAIYRNNDTSRPFTVVAIDRSSGARTILVADSFNLENPRGLALDVTNNLAYTVDKTNRSAVEIDLDTGLCWVVSDDLTGTGTHFGSPDDVVLDSGHGRLIVADAGSSSLGIPSAIIGVNLTDRSRTTLSKADGTGTDIGTGPRLWGVGSLALDAASNRVFMFDSSLYTVDLATGNRTGDSFVPAPNSRDMSSAASLVYDAARGRLLATDVVHGYVFAIDVATNNRTVVAGTEHGTGGDLGGMRGVALDPNGEFLYSAGPYEIVEVDTATGNRVDVLSPHTAVVPMAYDLQHGQILVTELGTLYSLNVSTKGLTALASVTFPSDAASALPYDPTTRLLYVATADNGGQILSIHVDTGTQTIVSDSTHGSGLMLVNPGEMALDAASQRLLVIDDGLRALLEVGLANGNRTLVAGDTRGNGETLLYWTAPTLDIDHHRLFAIDGSSTVVSVNLSTGDRTTVSSANRGRGPELFSPSALAFDPQHERLFVGDQYAIFVVDIMTGDRAIVSR